MPETPMRDAIEERDYRRGYERVMWYAKQAKLHGMKLSDRQLIHEITQHERAAWIREQSSLPIIGTEVRSAAWNRGEADALRVILREQHER